MNAEHVKAVFFKIIYTLFSLKISQNELTLEMQIRSKIFLNKPVHITIGNYLNAVVFMIRIVDGERPSKNSNI